MATQTPASSNPFSSRHPLHRRARASVAITAGLLVVGFIAVAAVVTPRSAQQQPAVHYRHRSTDAARWQQTATTILDAERQMLAERTAHNWTPAIAHSTQITALCDAARTYDRSVPTAPIEQYVLDHCHEMGL